jgi:endonuclease/exonuclease/phosphatase family metal-dependent hydrolase
VSRVPDARQGRPFDEIAALSTMGRDGGSWLDADVLVLPELWIPHEGPGLLDRLAEMGFEAMACTRFVTLGFGERPHVARPGEGWWVLAVAGRQRFLATHELALPRGVNDPVPLRHALHVEIAVDDLVVDLVAFHVSSKLWYLSPPRQLRGLARHVRDLGSARPAILVGDANWWRSTLPLWLPGWRPAVRGATFTSWRPHSQIDHVLTRGRVAVSDAEVASRSAGSDHRAVRATLIV